MATPFSLGVAEARLNVDYSGLSRGMRDAERAFDSGLGRMSQQVANFGRGVRDAGIGLVAITAPLNAFTGIAVKTAAGFEKSLRNIEALGGLTGKEIDSISDKAQQLGRDTIFAASDALGAFEDMIKDGRTVAESLASIDTILNVAAAANMNLADTQTYVSDTLDIFGLSAEHAAEAAQTLVSAAFTSPATFEEIALSLRNAGVSANTLGIPLEDVSAALVILARQGQRGAEAGTKLRQFFDYLKPTTEKAALAMQQIGVDAFDAEGNFIGLGEVIEQFKKGLDGLSTEEQKDILSDIFGIRAAQAAQLLINYDETLDEVKLTMGGVGDVADIARMQMDTFDGSVRSLKGSFEIFMIKAATPFMKDILRPLVRLTIPIVNLFSSWAQKNPTLTKTILALGAIIGGLGVAMIVLGQGLVFAAPGLVLIGGLFGALLSPIGLLIGGLSALAFAVTTNVFDIRSRLNNLGLTFGTWLKGLGGIFGRFGDIVLSVLGRSLGENLRDVFSNLLGENFTNWIGRAFDIARGQLRDLGPEKWIEVAKGLFDSLKLGLNLYDGDIPVLAWAQGLVSKIGAAFRDDEGNLYAFWQDPIGEAVKWMEAGVQYIHSAITDFLSDPVGTILDAAAWAESLVSPIAISISDYFEDKAGKLVEFWQAPLDDVKAFVSDGTNTIKKSISNFFAEPIEAISDVVTWSSNLIESVRLSVSNFFIDAEGTLTTFWDTTSTDVVDFVKAGVALIEASVGDFFADPVGSIKNVGVWALSFLKKIISGIGDVLGDANQWISVIGDQFGTIGADILTWIKENIVDKIFGSVTDEAAQTFRDPAFQYASASGVDYVNIFSNTLTPDSTGVGSGIALPDTTKQTIKSFVIGWIDGIIVEIKNTFFNVKSWVIAGGIDNTFKSILDSVAEKLVKLLFGRETANRSQATTDQFGGMESTVIAQGWARYGIERISKSIVNTFTSITNWITAFASDLGTNAGKVFQSVRDWVVRQMVTLLFGTAPEAGTLNTRTLSMSQQEIINDWAKVNINMIGQKISEAFSDVKTWVASIVPDFGSIRTSIMLALSNLFGADTSLETVDESMYQTTHTRRKHAEQMKVVAEEIADIDAQIMGEASGIYVDELFRRRRRLEQALEKPTTLGGVASVLTGARAAAFAATAGAAAASSAKLPALPALVPSLLSGRLGRSVKGWASGIAVGLATTAIYYLAPAFGVQLGIQGFIGDIVGEIAGAFDKALGTDYISGSEYHGKIHEWAMNNGLIIHGIITTGLATIFRAKFLGFFGIAQIVAGIIKSDVDAISDQPDLQETSLRERIAAQMASIQTSIINAVSSFTGGGTEEDVELSPFALQLQSVLDPLFGIADALTTSTFDLLARLPVAGENIRQFIDNIIGKPGAERTDSTVTLLDSVTSFLSNIGEAISNIIVLASEIPTNIAAPAFAGGFGGVAAETLEQAAARPAPSLISAGALFAIGTAFGGPIVGAIAGFIGLYLPGALFETLTLAMSEEELAKAGINKDSVIASGVIGAIAGAVIGSATGNPFLLAAGSVIGGAIGIGTKEGLVKSLSGDNVIAAIGAALFGATTIASFFTPLSKTASRRRGRMLQGRAGGAAAMSIAGMLAPDLMQAMAGELEPEEMSNLITGIAGGLVGAAIFGIYGAAIGVAIGKHIAPAMWDTFKNAILTDEEGMAAGLTGFERGLNNALEFVTSTAAFSVGTYTTSKGLGKLAEGGIGNRLVARSTRLTGIATRIDKMGPMAAKFKGIGSSIGGIIAFFAADYFTKTLGPQITQSMEGMDEIDPGEFIKLQAGGAVVGGITGAILGSVIGIGPVIGGVIGMTAGQAFGPAFALGMETAFADVGFDDWSLGESLSQNVVEIGGIAAATGILVALSGGSALVVILAAIGASIAYIMVDAFFKAFLPSMVNALREGIVSASTSLGIYGIGPKISRKLGLSSGDAQSNNEPSWYIDAHGTMQMRPRSEFTPAQINVPRPAYGSVGGTGGGLGGFTEASQIGSRDLGGPGAAGMPYLIGRRAQPELFVPNSAGQFYPNADKMMQQGDTYQVTINAQIPAGADADTYGNRMGAAFRRQVDRR